MYYPGTTCYQANFLIIPRYLQKAIMKLDYEQYKMVKEALHERANLLEIAPHLSFPLPIMLPVYRWWQVGSGRYDVKQNLVCLAGNEYEVYNIFRCII